MCFCVKTLLLKEKEVNCINTNIANRTQYNKFVNLKIVICDIKYQNPTSNSYESLMKLFYDNKSNIDVVLNLVKQN